MTLLILSITGCKTTQPSEGVYIPKLDVSVPRPVLEPIPELELTNLSPEEENALADVLAVYNRNLMKLVVYSNELLDLQEVIINYYTEINKVVN